MNIRRILKVATWNVNSIRQRAEAVSALLVSENLDVLLLQELKCQESDFPLHVFNDLSYNVILKCQKGYNGVAIASRWPITKISDEIYMDGEARYIEGVISFFDKCIRLISIYIPNAQAAGSPRFEYKMQFHDALARRIHGYLLNNNDIMLLGGDMNAAPEDIDVYDPVKLDGCTGFHIEERSKLRELLNLGLFDTFRMKYPTKQEFSWWDYRGGGLQRNEGMRIDHILASAEGMDHLLDCYILKELRHISRPSDHVPVVCVLNGF
ncbi:exodeoxyribonuclease III [Neorickettsia sennetsu]|uniref:Exodeoxyribonuclease III n=1 Tax=Ehrlichia sennetsu (strain ATCC VR-367 / Miyayama) TaxID=222891 RepID=Q2GDZ5_EHRS3|nr:exodeoxyribonuclease III [Neorickettsia sennetsu]ABD46406.1 exodeoxyribonuclease III [Neorickettsia sennetsu str. Miyayama]